MEGIKNLIIDFGGVIINLTRNRCVEAFESFGVPDVRDCILNSKDLFMQIEMGTITSAEFRDGIRHLTQQRLTDEQIDAAADWIKEVTNDAVMGIIRPETIDMALKAINHDADISFYHTHWL